jgi:hypothetical protein
MVRYRNHGTLRPLVSCAGIGYGLAGNRGRLARGPKIFEGPSRPLGMGKRFHRDGVVKDAGDGLLSSICRR